MGPEVADELELTILDAMIDPLEPLRLRTGDVIVSESFEDLVKLAVEARSNETPRKTRPGLKMQMEVTRLGSSGFELGKLRDYVGANFNGAAPSPDVLRGFGWGPIQPEAARQEQFELDNLKHVRQHYLLKSHEAAVHGLPPRPAHTEGSMPYTYGGPGISSGSQVYKSFKLTKYPEYTALRDRSFAERGSNDDVDGNGEEPPTPPLIARCP